MKNGRSEDGRKGGREHLQGSRYPKAVNEVHRRGSTSAGRQEQSILGINPNADERGSYRWNRADAGTAGQYGGLVCRGQNSLRGAVRPIQARIIVVGINPEQFHITAGAVPKGELSFGYLCTEEHQTQEKCNDKMLFHMFSLG